MHAEPDDPNLLGDFLNRKAFEEQFKLAFKQAANKNESISLAFVDIDNFKDVNERYGNLAGDQVLKMVARIIRELSGNTAILGRYGGDEFGLIFPNTEREQAFLILEQIRLTVEKNPIQVNGREGKTIQVFVSAGIASYPIDGSTETELLRNADQAIYRAKESGRNRVRLAFEERMVPKTTHFTLTQLERLSKLAREQNRVEADLLREALDDLLIKYKVSEIIA